MPAGTEQGADQRFTDRRMLVDHAYADGEALSARRSIYAYQEPRIDLAAMAVAAVATLPLSAGKVVDVGCGNGVYAAAIHQARPDLAVMGIDVSAGMRPHVVADVQWLPIRSASVEAVLCMHMLYHVADIAKAVAELRRVVSATGVVVVSTNTAQDKREIDQLWSNALRRLGALAAPRPIGDERFLLEEASVVLSHAFSQVTVDQRRARVVVPIAAPVIRYLDSMRGLAEQALPAQVSWSSFLSAAHSEIDRILDESGAFELTSDVGILVARP